MAEVIVLTKELIGIEDLLLGSGSVTQVRGGVSLAITKVNIDSVSENLITTDKVNKVIGLGNAVIEPDWGGGTALQLDTQSAILAWDAQLLFYSNALSPGGFDTYYTSAAATLYASQFGTHTFFCAPSGIAGDVITWKTPLYLTENYARVTGYLDLRTPTFTSDAPFINFQATADADAISAISTLTTSGAVTHHIQISVNGVTAWIPVSTTDPT